jgi:hypothetical protein
VVKARACLACRQVERSVSFREPVVAIRLRHDSINQPVVLGVGVNERAKVQVAENVAHANIRHPLSAPESVEVIPAVAKCRAKLVSGSGRVDTFTYLSDSVFLLRSAAE